MARAWCFHGLVAVCYVTFLYIVITTAVDETDGMDQMNACRERWGWPCSSVRAK